MNVLRRLLCTIGLHTGQWSFPGVRCESVRVCRRCHETEKTIATTR